MIYGYGKVPASDHNRERHIQHFVDAGVSPEQVFMEEVGRLPIDKSQLPEVVSILNTGDTLFLDDIDRLGITYQTIVDNWKYITLTTGADIVVIGQENVFDSRVFHECEDAGKALEALFINLMSIIATRERKRQSKHRREGAARARENGTILGRRRLEGAENIDDIVQQWVEGKIRPSVAVALSGLKKSTFYARYGKLKKAARHNILQNDDNESLDYEILKEQPKD